MSCVKINFNIRSVNLAKNLFGNILDVVLKLYQNIDLNDNVDILTSLNLWLAEGGNKTLLNILDSGIVKENKLKNPKELLEYLADEIERIYLDLGSYSSPTANWSNNMDLDVYQAYKGNIILENYRLKEFKREAYKLLFFLTITNRSSVKNSVKILQQYLNTEESDIDTLIESVNVNLDNLPQEVTNAYIELKFNSKKMILSNEDLNLGIIEFKIKLYKKIAKFLQTIYPEIQIKSYIQKGKVDADYVNDLISKMQQYINNSSDDIELVKLWEIKRKNPQSKKDYLALEAVNAFLNIKYFDETLKSECGDLFNIDTDLAREPDKFTLGGTTILKYTIGVDRSTVSKNWSKGEFADALAETSKEHLLLLGTLHLHSWDTKSIQLDAIQQSLISIAWGKLCRAAYNISTSDSEISECLKDILLFHDNPHYYALKIFSFLFSGRRSSNQLIRDLYSQEGIKFAKSDIDILYSLYCELLNTKATTSNPTVSYIETQNIVSGEDSLFKYLKQDLILGILDHALPATYVRTKMDLLERKVISDNVSKNDHLNKSLLDKRDSLLLKLRRLRSKQETGYPVEKYKLKANSISELLFVLGKGTLLERTFKLIGVDDRDSSILSPIISKSTKKVILIPTFTEEELEILHKVTSETTKDLLDIFYDINSNKRKKLKEQLLDLIKDKKFKEDLLLPIINLLETFSSSKHTTDTIINSSYGTKVRNNILDWNGEDIKPFYLHELLKFMNFFLNLQLNTEDGLLILENYGSIHNGATNSILTTAAIIAMETARNDDFFNYCEKEGIKEIWSRYLPYMQSRGLDIDTKTGDFAQNVNEYYFTTLGSLEWLDGWFESEASVLGSETQATTLDNKGNRIANFRPTNLASQYYYYLTKYSDDSESVPYETLFVQNKQLIKDCVYDLDMESWDNSKKAVKDATTPELLHNGIMHDFWARFINKGELQIIPTVYSDKTSFVSYIIDGNKKITLAETINGKTTIYLENKSLLELSEEESLLVYEKTIGSYFRKSYNNIIEDFSKLICDAKHFENFRLLSLLEINEWLNRIKDTTIVNEKGESEKLSATEILELYIKNYNKSHSDSKINIATETHFRYNKEGKNLYLNELVAYYGTLQFNTTTLKKRFEKEKVNFIKNLLNNNVNFWYDSKFDKMQTVILLLLTNHDTARLFMQETDKIKNLKSEIYDLDKQIDSVKKEIQLLSEQAKTDSNITSQLEQKRLEREVLKHERTELNNNLREEYKNLNYDKWLEDFKKLWFTHGKMILAKDSFGNNITSVDLLKNLSEITLNPILEKYFYADNIVSANIKYAMTGSEVADPLKAAKLKMSEDFDINSKNSDKSIKTKELIELLTALEGTDLLKDLQKTDLTSMQLLLQNSKDKVGELQHFRDVYSELYETVKTGRDLIVDELDLIYDEFNAGNYREDDSVRQTLLELILEKINKYNKEIAVLSSKKHMLTLLLIYDNLIYRVIATSEGTLYKRNVIWTATRTDVQRMALSGLGESTNVAIIEDLLAPVFTPNGTSTSEDADDGSAVIVPMQAIMENNSLGANAVGYTNKKPIWHYYDPRTGTCVLLKFATFTLSNGLMLTSMDSDKCHYNLFKKMTKKLWGENKYDLLNSVAYKDGSPSGSKLNFQKYIIGALPGKSKGLFYKEGSYVYEILDMIKIGDTYYTKERNTLNDSISYVALLFDENSNSSKSILRSQEGIDLESDQFEKYVNKIDDYKKSNDLHTINSIFELHDAMGGVYSQELNAKGEFINSENSNYAVVGFMNNVCIRKNNGDSLDLYTFELPLKKEFIGYAANKSAVKRGQFNMQSSKRWLDNEDLIYVSLDNRGLGSQMDADHTADEAEVSEPTLVIASLDAGGYTHDVAKLAFEDIGKAVESGLRVNMGEMTKLIRLLSNKNLTDVEQKQLESRIRDIFGREFVRTFKARNLTDLSQSIINVLRDQFLISDDHTNDEFKLPLSDPNLFSQVVSNVTSVLNKKGLKRKYSGLGTVMCPGYKNAQIYHINGNNYTYNDIVRKARKKDPNKYLDDITSIADFGKVARDIDGHKMHIFRQHPESLGWTPETFKVEGSIYLIETDDPNEFIFGSTNTLNLTNLEKAKIYLAIRKFLPIGAEITIPTDTMLVNSLSYLDLVNFKKYGFLNSGELTFAIPDTVNDPNFEYIVDNGTRYIKVPDITLGQLSSVLEDKILAKAYLQDLLNELDLKDYSTPNVEYRFLPTDIVKVNYPGGEELIDLDKVENYFLYKEWVYYIHNKQVLDMSRAAQNIFVLKYGVDNIKISEDVIRPKTLRPQRVSFKYSYNGQIFDGNIYDLDSVRYSILNNKELKENRDKCKEYLKQILKDFNSIDDETSVKIYTPDGPIEVNIVKGSVIKEEAELMMSNINKSIFGQYDKSLAECLENFVPKTISKTYSTTEELFLVGNKKKTAIIFDKPLSGTTFLRMSTAAVYEDDKYKIKMLSPEENEPMFDVGILIETTDYLYDEKLKKFRDTKTNSFIDTLTQGNAAVTPSGDRLIYRNGKVYKDIYFVRSAIDNVATKNGNKLRYSYYIDRDAIETHIGKLQANGYIGNVLNQIAQSTYCTHILLGDKISKSNIPHLTKILQECRRSLTGNNRDFFLKVLDINILTLDECNNIDSDVINLFDINPKEKESLSRDEIHDLRRNKKYIKVVGNLTYEEALNDACKTLTEKIKQSFKLSQYFIAARIPAQSLQSYMKMKLVGYIPINNNECMVSHWQTLLQGSKNYNIPVK